VALGAVIIVASLGLIDIAAFRFLRHVRPSEFWLAVVTAFGVLTVGVLAGILVAVMVSLITILYRISRPHDALLDDVDAAGGTVYRGVADKETALTEPGLIAYRFDAPLVFPNAAFFTERLEELVANAGAGLKCVILDAEAISDFDSTAAEALENLDADLERQGVDLWIARANTSLRELLTTTGLMKRLGAEHVYPSVRAAVEAYHAQYGAATQ
jgi:SulP family sulfate permease